MRSKINGFVVVVLSVFVSIGSATGEEVEAEKSSAPPGESSPLVEYRKKALSSRLSLWSGLKLQQAGKELKLGYFGGGYQNIFEGSPSALESMKTFQKMRISGVVLYGVGLATMLSLLFAGDSLVEENADGKRADSVFWVVLFTGLGVSLTGAGLMQGANSYLADAIHQYNDDLFERLNSRVSGISPRFRMAYSFRF